MKRFEYKKVIGFTLQQKRAFDILEKHGVNVNKFIATNRSHAWRSGGNF